MLYASGSAATVTLKNCVLSGNHGDPHAGAVFIRYSAKGTFEDCTFSDNTAKNFGGAIHLSDFASAIFSRCSLIKNTAAAHGGAAITQSAASVVFESCTLNDNSAGMWGGAVYIDNNDKGGCKGTFIGSTLNGNKATSAGGAIYNLATTLIESCEINGNSAGLGGAIQSAGGTVTIADSVYKLNTLTKTSGSGESFRRFPLSSSLCRYIYNVIARTNLISSLLFMYDVSV